MIKSGSLVYISKTVKVSFFNHRAVPLLKPPQSSHCYLGAVDHAKKLSPTPGPTSKDRQSQEEEYMTIGKQTSAPCVRKWKLSPPNLPKTGTSTTLRKTGTASIQPSPQRCPSRPFAASATYPGSMVLSANRCRAEIGSSRRRS